MSLSAAWPLPQNTSLEALAFGLMSCRRCFVIFHFTHWS